MALCCYIGCGADIEVVKKCASGVKQFLFQILVLDVVIQMVVVNSVVTWIVLSYNSFDPIEILPCLYRTLGPAEAVGHSDG